MKKFHLQADCVFEAENIGDALRRLSEYLSPENYPGEESLFLPPASFEIRPFEDGGDPE